MTTYRINQGKIKRTKYNENYKVRRLDAIRPKGYDGKIKTETKDGVLVAKYYKKKKNEK